MRCFPARSPLGDEWRQAKQHFLAGYIWNRKPPELVGDVARFGSMVGPHGVDDAGDAPVARGDLCLIIERAPVESRSVGGVDYGAMFPDSPSSRRSA